MISYVSPPATPSMDPARSSNLREMDLARQGKVGIESLAIVVLEMCMVARQRTVEPSLRAWALIIADDALNAFRDADRHRRTYDSLRRQWSSAAEFVQQGG